MSSIHDALLWRYATKQYDASKKVAEGDFNQILEAARLSASSYGLQPWKMVVVTNPELRTKLRAAAWDQSQITDASHLVVFAIEKNLDSAYVDEYIDLVSKTRGVSKEMLKGYEDMMKGSISGLTQESKDAWNGKQAYIALGTALLAAADLKIDSTPMEGFDKSQFDEILGLSKMGLASAVVLALGYRSSEDKSASYAKVRFPMEEMVVKM